MADGYSEFRARLSPQIPRGTGWRGTALNTPPAASRPPAPETPEQRAAKTGVNPGGTGYVSGQVAPGAAVPGVTATTSTRPAVGTGGGEGWRAGLPAAPTSNPNAVKPLPVAPAVGGDEVKVTGALTAGGAPAPAPAGVPAPLPSAPAAGAAPVPGAASAQGTVPGYNPLGPTVSGAVGMVPVVGDIANGLLTTSRPDTGPAVNAQNAAFGLGQDIEQERYDYRPGDAAYQERVALDQAASEQLRQKQLTALGALDDAAAGRVPSAAELQLRSQSAKNNAAALGAARALGGRSAGGAARAATLSAADNNIETQAIASQMRATEQAAARNAYISALGGVRGQDVGIATTNAGLAQDANQNNLNAQLEQNRLAEAHRQALIDAQLKAFGIGAGSAGDIVGANRAAADAENKAKGGYVSAIGSALGV